MGMAISGRHYRCCCELLLSRFSFLLLLQITKLLALLVKVVVLTLLYEAQVRLRPVYLGSEPVVIVRLGDLLGYFDWFSRLCVMASR